MQDLEEDKEMRESVLIYKGLSYCYGEIPEQLCLFTC